jgi:hypothetical protein
MCGQQLYQSGDKQWWLLYQQLVCVSAAVASFPTAEDLIARCLQLSCMVQCGPIQNQLFLLLQAQFSCGCINFCFLSLCLATTGEFFMVDTIVC